MTGMPGPPLAPRAGSARSRLQTSSPSMPGSPTSRTTSRGRSRLAAASPSSPVPAFCTRNPSLRRYSSTRSAMLASSSTTRMVPPAPGWLTESIFSPPAAVDDLTLRAAPPLQRRRRLVGCRPADGQRPDRVELGRDPERRPERRQAVEDTEEQGAEALVDGGEEHGHGGEAAIDVPVGDGPAGRVPVGPALDGFGVAIEVGLLRGAGQDDHRRPEQAGPAEAGPPLGRECAVPEPPDLLGALEDEEGGPLGVPGRRRPAGVVEDPLQGTGRYGPVLEVADHPPPADRLPEFHRPGSAARQPLGRPSTRSPMM